LGDSKPYLELGPHKGKRSLNRSVKADGIHGVPPFGHHTCLLCGGSRAKCEQSYGSFGPSSITLGSARFRAVASVPYTSAARAANWTGLQHREPSQNSVIDFGDVSEVSCSAALGLGADITRTHNRRS